jgi:hypothetical protein
MAKTKTAKTNQLERDRETLDTIADLVSGREWNADTIDAIADVLRRAGFLIADMESEPLALCSTCRNPAGVQVVPKGSGDAMCSYCGADWPAPVW